MARPRQKKKQRSSKASVKTGKAGRTKAGKKKVNFLGNEIIRKNWDRKLTLAQNYERLGLSVRLGDRTGGVEKRGPKIGGRGHVSEDEDEDEDVAVQSRYSLRIGAGNAAARMGQLVPMEVEVETDPDTGAILRIVGDDTEKGLDASRSLNDPLNLLEADEEDGFTQEMDIDGGEGPTVRSNKNRNTNEIVRQLEAQAAAEEEELLQKKKPRKQSSREQDWVQALVEKYDDDYSAMFRDRKLNPMQQSEGDIKKRVKKWKAANAQDQG